MSFLRGISGAFLLSAFLVEPAPAQTTFPVPPRNPQIDETGVNVTTGSRAYKKPLLNIGPDGQNNLEYSYLLPGWPFAGWFEFTAYFSGDMSINASFENLSQTIFNSTIYSWDGPGINADNDGWYMTGTDGTVYRYDSVIFSGNCTMSIELCGGIASHSYYRISEIQFPNGEDWEFHYRIESGQDPTRSYRLQSVTTNTGFQIKFEYQSNTFGDSGFLSLKKAIAVNNAIESCDPDADTCNLTGAWKSISFSGDTIEDPEGAIWTFSGSSTTRNIFPPNSSTPTISDVESSIAGPTGPNCLAVAPYRIVSSTVNGVSASYSYTNVNNTNQTWRVTRTGPTGSRIYDSRITNNRGGACPEIRPGVTRFVDELNRQSLFEFDFGDRLTKATFPEGNAVEYVPGAARPTDIINHAKDGATTSVHQVFPACPTGAFGTVPDKVCFKPTSITDARGNTTDFTYDPAHGGVLTKTGPANASGVRPQTRYTYVQRYAWVKSGSGYAHAASPVWLLASEEFCRTTAASGSGCAGGSSDEVVTTYDYGPDSGPNNLWLRGKVVTADGVSHRTCYQHDKYGQIIATTLPNANLSSCS